jgi:hypothetical protein
MGWGGEGKEGRGGEGWEKGWGEVLLHGCWGGGGWTPLHKVQTNTNCRSTIIKCILSKRLQLMNETGYL